MEFFDIIHVAVGGVGGAYSTGYGSFPPCQPSLLFLLLVGCFLLCFSPSNYSIRCRRFHIYIECADTICIIYNRFILSSIAVRRLR